MCHSDQRKRSILILEVAIALLVRDTSVLLAIKTFSIAAPGAVEIIAHTKLLTQVRKARVVAISPFFLAAWIN